MDTETPYIQEKVEEEKWSENLGSESSVSSSDENKLRGNWTGKLDFLLSCLSYAVGLGNLWRFPYLCYNNGGGAFLIPYVFMLTFVGMPLFFMELSFGQFASLGVVSVWKVSPIFQGIGYGMFLVSIFVGMYYNMIIAWTLFYTFASFTSELPWMHCDNEWNTEACNLLHLAAEKNCSLHNGTYFNTTCYQENADDYEMMFNITNNFTSNQLKLRTASDEYFHNHVLEITDGIHNLKGLKWELSLCLLLAWVLVALCLIKGIKSSGKVVYFTASFPYIVLCILLVRGVTLDGSLDGILFYVTPKWERLLTAKVWGDAAVQIFFSLSPCWGGLITLASYNKFHNNCLRDAIFVSVGNCLTSVFAGFVIFSIIGYMAHELDLPVDKVVSQGAGLAFVVYPQVVTRLPISPLWSILFFAMLITLGLGTQFAVVTTIHTTILDVFPKTLRRGHRPMILMIVIAIVLFLLGLSCCSRGGMFMLQLIDSYAATYSVLIIGLCEIVALSWVYGYEKFFNDIKLMLGSYPSVWWRIMWCYVSPIILIFIIVFTWIDFKPTSYGDYTFPVWADALGWMLTFTSVMPIPVVAMYKIVTQKTKLPLLKRIKALSEPAEDWGPALNQHKRECMVQDNDDMNEFNVRLNSSNYIHSNTTVSSTAPLQHETSI